MALFQKGTSGNPAGRKPGKNDFDEVLRRRLNRASGKQAKALADALIELALSKQPGCVGALKLIVERSGGRPATASPPAPPPLEKLSPEEVNRRLAELVSTPEVKERLRGLLAQSDEGKAQ